MSTSTTADGPIETMDLAEQVTFLQHHEVTDEEILGDLLVGGARLADHVARVQSQQKTSTGPTGG